jgi:hypothetical protein
MPVDDQSSCRKHVHWFATIAILIEIEALDNHLELVGYSVVL